MEYPNRIKVARAYLKLSIQDFARQYNVSVDDVERWEAEKSAPPIELAATLAKRLRVKLAFILGHEYVLTKEYDTWHDDQKEDYEAECFSEWQDVIDYFLYVYGKGKFISEPEYVSSYVYGLLNGDTSYSPDLKPLIDEYVETLQKKYEI